MKYLLDTTVLSAFAMGLPNVLAHLKATPKRDVAVSTVTIMEVEYGLRLNPARVRKLRHVIDALLRDVGVLPYARRFARPALPSDPLPRSSQAPECATASPS